MKFLIINPQLLFNSQDKLTTGIIYLPIAIASISANLKKSAIDHKVLDLFGNAPKKINKLDNFFVLGENIEKYSDEIKSYDAIFVYANQVINHLSIINIIKQIRSIDKTVKIITFENTQAVTAYSLKDIYKNFVFTENDHVLIGEPEEKIQLICKNINKHDELKKINGLICNSFQNLNRDLIENLDSLPFPDWSQIPLQNYWDLKYAHGPLSSKRYISILTSRGCPYPCKFCVVPETNNRRWRYKSSIKVVDEIENYIKEYNIKEFHFEDLNPTVNETRTIELCNEIIKRNLNITWKIVAGTKVESIKKTTTLELMARSGCKYISISPESGSMKIMKEIGKPFDINHAYKIVKSMNENKIFSQACFVLGYPGENQDDLNLTKKMIYNLTKNGIDEIAIFIISPIPGSEIFDSMSGYSNFSELNFSPIWRKDYSYLFKKRLQFYMMFLSLKIIFFPIKIIKQIWNFLTLNFQTKMEMVPYKYLKLSILTFRL
tara:strand:+ start:13 stop:1485 length:1473 start_codon:yes stop_codon:yes gene_type:complete